MGTRQGDGEINRRISEIVNSVTHSQGLALEEHVDGSA